MVTGRQDALYHTYLQIPVALQVLQDKDKLGSLEEVGSRIVAKLSEQKEIIRDQIFFRTVSE